jgi:virulence-associated protein VapD
MSYSIVISNDSTEQKLRDKTGAFGLELNVIKDDYFVKCKRKYSNIKPKHFYIHSHTYIQVGVYGEVKHIQLQINIYDLHMKI